jgi:DNA-directed RNA polymerase
MRFKDSIEQKNHIAAASGKGYLEGVFHGLEVLSSTPWRINRKVFDTVLEAWNSGSGIADIPAAPENCDYTVPEKPANAATDPAARVAYQERLKAVLLQQKKDHGERCKFNYNLEIARAYLNDVFYIPHNMDFRGRAYPIPPHLSPVGDDLCRGLLTFGISKPLGKTGLKWLQIHLANVYGFDKASFEERAQFARDHEADIFDSADKPLEGNRWWLKAEDPWQCLATCFELAAALRSPNPETFESSIPVHQDGTCNGMQHYAALGGDVRGAKAVNLERGDRPADIYTGVADLVNAAIEEDRKAGLPMALLIKGELGRKVVKQTVMTTVYGVTFIGAREQIARQLIARGGLHAEDVYPVSAYVARKVLASIGDLFAGARAIQDWLTLCARLIARSIPASRLIQATQLPEGALSNKGRSRKDMHLDERARREAQKSKNLAKELMTAVAWTTPIGLPVVQPYRKGAKKQIMTSLQTVYITDPHQMTEVAPMKQATAFPPNYIHSLDATHMLLTAVGCNNAGVTFASVHDSYWTHASTVELMSDQIREKFIQLHSDDLIGALRNQFLEQYGDHAIPVSNARLIESAKERNEARVLERRPPPVHGAAPHDLADELAADEEDDELDPDAVEVKDDSEAILSAAELAEFGGYQGTDEVTVNGVKFIKLRALLPPTPPRGKFDVSRVSDSAYFFS